MVEGICDDFVAPVTEAAPKRLVSYVDVIDKSFIDEGVDAI